MDTEFLYYVFLADEDNNYMHVAMYDTGPRSDRKIKDLQDAVAERLADRNCIVENEKYLVARWNVRNGRFDLAQTFVVEKGRFTVRRICGK
jgi:hypothetical protein